MENDPTLADVLEKINRADLVEFYGMQLKAVNDHGTLGDTPLHIAAIWGDVGMGKVLIDAGADLEAHGEYGHTPLHEAVGQGHFEFAELLLSHGASREARNDWGWTPVDSARSSGDPRFIELLVKNW